MKKIIPILASISFFGCSSNGIFNIKGKISMYGSVPHTYIGIKDSKSQKIFKISNASKFNLKKLQNHIVDIQVKLEKEAIGAGFPTVVSVIKVKR